MRQTLFHIPHELYGLPVFGLWSWGSLLVLLIAAIQLAAAKGPDRQTTFQSNIFVWITLLLVNAFLLPRIETRIDDWPVGLPIRGYGVMLMLGVLSGVAVALRRSEKRGVSREAFFSLATTSVVSGIIGARLFYVIQHWDTLAGHTIGEKLISALQFTEGGLVVYGGVIGGLLAIVVWTYRYRYSLLSVADAVTPAFFIGLTFGRIGCLLNGCCFGGVCGVDLPSVAFPPGSAVYEEQLADGRLFGLTTERQKIVEVAPGSWAETAGIKPGSHLDRIVSRPVDGPNKDEPLRPIKYEAAVTIDGEMSRLSTSDVPSRSVGVHPSQVYASIGAFVLFLWTLSVSPFLKRTGLVFSAGLIAYGCVRILEEYIRVDEAGQFGTELSISQWISLIGILLGVGIAAYVTSRGRNESVKA